MSRISFDRIATPGAVPQDAVTILSYLAIIIIFTVGAITGYQRPLQILYFIPLFMIALHDRRSSVVIAAVALSIALQVITVLTFRIHPVVTIIEIVTVTFTSVTVALLSRYARRAFLQHLNSNNQQGAQREK